MNVIEQGDGKPAKEEVGIETRGEGGYIVSVLSPSKVHPLNKPYVQTLGPPLPELPVITPDERKLLWAAARSFDQRPKYRAK